MGILYDSEKKLYQTAIVNRLFLSAASSVMVIAIAFIGGKAAYSVGVNYGRSISAYALLANNVSILPVRISEQFVGDVVQLPQFGSALAVVLMRLMVLSIIMNGKILKRVKGGR